MWRVGVILLALSASTRADEGGPTLACPPVQGLLRLDGRLDEPFWQQAEPAVLAQKEQIHPAYREAWKGPQDLSARVRAVRAGPDLVLGFEVTDDRLLHESGRAWWVGDSIEVFLDTDLVTEETNDAYSADDYQLFLMPFHEGLRWGVVSRGPDVPYPDGGLHGIEVACTRTNSGYSLEARLPLAAFDLRPDERGRIGFDVALNDVDTPGAPMTETYLTLSGRFELYASPANFGRLALGAVDRTPAAAAAGPAGTAFDWWTLLAGLLALLAFALVGRRAARRFAGGPRARLLALAAVSSGGAVLLAASPSLVAALDEQGVGRRWGAAVDAAEAAARGHLLLDARPAAERAEGLLALLRDGQVRIRPHYRYRLLAPRGRAAGPLRYGIRLDPGEVRRFPLDGIAAPAAIRLHLAMPEPGLRRAAALPAAEIRLDFEEGPPAIQLAERAPESRVRVDLSDREGTPLVALRLRNLLSFEPLVVHALHALPGGDPLPLAARSPSGVPLDVWRGTPASNIVRVGRGALHTTPLAGLAGNRLWIALGAEGAYPQTPYGVDVARIAVVYAGEQPGPELRLRNGLDVQESLLASYGTGGPEIALQWEEAPLRLPRHYSLHAVDLDPGRSLERLEVEDLGVLGSLQIAAVTLGRLDAASPPAGSELVLQGDRLTVAPDVHARWRGFGLRVTSPEGAVHAAGPARGVRLSRELPFGAAGRGQLEIVLPRGPWALAALRGRGVAFGGAALLLAVAAVLAGAALLQRSRRLRIKMLVALGAATVAPLLFLAFSVTTTLGERAEESLREATLSDLQRVRQRVLGARERAASLASRVRDTLELVRTQGEEALSHQVRRAREDLAAEGAFLRMPDAGDHGPSPLGNARFVDAVTRTGLYYSPWDGLLAVGVASTMDRHRCLVGLSGAGLLGEAPSPEAEAVLYGPAGNALAASRGLPAELREPAAQTRLRERIAALALASEPAYERAAMLRGEPTAVARELLLDDGRPVGVLSVHRSRRATEEAKASLFRTVLLSALAALALVVLAGGTLVDSVTARLQRVTRTARALAQGNLASRVPVESEDEVGRLATSFNRMADALDDRMRQLTDLHGGLQDLTAALARDEVAQAAARLLARATGARHVLVASFDRATEHLEPLHREGNGAPLGPRLPESGPLRDAVEKKTPLLREGALFLPLLAAGRTVGVAVGSPVADDGRLDRRFLDASGRQIGIALENARLYHAAVTDELTGLYTETFFVRRLKEEVDRAAATGRPLSLLRVAIEDFAHVARRDGASVAARLLVETATVLERTLPRRNMVARRQAGELLALLVESDTADARRHLDRVAATLQRHEFEALDREPRPSFAYRSVTYPRDGAAADILLDTLFEVTESWDETAAVEAPALLKVPIRLGLMLGKSPTMRAALEIVARVAPTNATVLLSGETGAGKEVLADLLQANSDRRTGPFVKVNCAAIPESLLEAELFGHERGAFTGAERRRIGRFEEAHRGTLFLDEVGDLPVAMQVKLLRFLQERRITRVGGTTPMDIDVRILAATNRDLAEAVRAGSFREDLYHRLHVIELRVPPLRERREDIAQLVDHFRRVFNRQHGLEVESFSPDALDRLYRHPWPGNVRQLRNVVERAMLLTGGAVVEPAHLALPEQPAARRRPPAVRAQGLTPRQERILAFAREEGGVTNRDVVHHESVSARTALRELQRLVDRGLLLRVGRRRGAVYRPPK